MQKSITICSGLAVTCCSVHFQREGNDPSVRRNTYQDPHLDVEKGQLQTVEEGLLLAVYPIILANVLFQSPSC